MFIGFRDSWAYLFNNDPGWYFFHSFNQSDFKLNFFFKKKTEVVKLVASILPILGIFQVFDGCGAVTAGILRAKGKQVLTFYFFFFETPKHNFISSLSVPY